MINNEETNIIDTKVKQKVEHTDMNLKSWTSTQLNSSA
jgi:hypothetical protein